eukprot:scaffold613_cov89-Skeletonema_marinoi.AAC.3
MRARSKSSVFFSCPDTSFKRASVRHVRLSKRIPTYVPPVPTATYVHGRYVEFWRSGSSVNSVVTKQTAVP